MSRFLTFLVIASTVMAILCLALWGKSQANTFESYIPFPGANLGLGYDGGDFRIGAFDTSSPWRRLWWARTRRMDLSDVGPHLDLKMDGRSWAVSIPFPLLIIFFAIPPAWFVMVFRDRSETERRVRLGLCMTCGYDPRGTPDRPCPECGAPPRAIPSQMPLAASRANAPSAPSAPPSPA